MNFRPLIRLIRGCSLPKGYTDNAILSMCAVKSICDYLIAPNTITIKRSAYIEIIEVSIFNPAGTKVLQQPAPVNEIDISRLQPGLYFVEVVTGKGAVRKKLVVE